jgi:dTDP-4-dehydrorhamnose 3,5-epimerase
MLPAARKSPRTVTPAGELILPDLLDGLQLKTVQNVLARNGVVTELWRPEWLGPETRPGHVTYVTLAASSETNWHCHSIQSDLLFVVRGLIKIAFYDDREGSPSYRRLNVLPFSPLRPTLIAIPPGIWHALKNLDNAEAAYVTMNSRAFDYDDPDDWRLPPGDASLPRPF